MRIVARLDADVTVGMGHAVRLRAMIDALDPGAKVSIVGQGQGLASVFPEADIHAPGNSPVDRIAALVAEARADLVLCDHPRMDDKLRRDLPRHLEVPTVIVDDFGGDLRADGIVNGTVLSAHHRYPDLEHNTLTLCGGQFALLRAAFGAAERPSEPERALGIVIGSGARAVAWAEFLTSGDIDLASLGAVGIVVGQAYAKPSSLKARCAGRGITFYQGLPAKRLTQFLASSQVALVTGGMIVYESLAAGTPTIVFPLLPDMEAEAGWFAAHGCAINLGPEGGFEAEMLEHTIWHLLTDHEAREGLADAGRTAIDGQGVARVSAAIRERFALHVSGRE
jgi:spore coat polysaccharide biosynthesis predicted glycosyltransferase SpsG